MGFLDLFEPPRVLVFRVRIDMIMFTSFLIMESALSIDSRYEACRPKNCGGNSPIIQYPFSIRNSSTSFCGYPGFEVVCEDSQPVYETSTGHYIIQDISYDNKSFRIVSKEVLNVSTTSNCLALRYNFSLDRSPFKFRPLHADLFFTYNCTAPSEPAPKYPQIPITCGGFILNSSFLSLVPEDDEAVFTPETCQSSVLAPVELEDKEAVNATILTVDYNKLLRRGFTLEWSGIGCVECRQSGGYCGFNNTTRVCFCPNGQNPEQCNSGKENHMLPIIVSVTVGSVFILASLCLVMIFVTRRRYKHMKLRYLSKYLSWKKSTRDLEDGVVYFGVPVFSYAELEDATNNFDASKELGDGGFGTVYYGKLRDGREVAVKRLYENNYKRVEHFKNEVDILTRLRHPNLVLLYGCTSRRSRELLLVYEYIPNGTVADHLHGERAKSSSLTWPIRMNIAIETASALAYLHASEIIHRDVKTNNILLDENFNVKVADFGLSRLWTNDVSHVSTAPQGTPGYVDPEYFNVKVADFGLSRLWTNDVSHVSTAPQGTPGYVDPEYHQCYQLTDKSDVYSFGVVLIELISSMPAVDISRQRDEINLSNLAINRIKRSAFDELIDPNLGFKTDPTVERMTMLVAELAFRCLQFDKEARPTMKEAFEILKEIQGEEGSQEGRDSIGELTNVKPPHSPETKEAVLLKTSTFPPSPISVADKWYSSRSTTPSASGGI